MAGWPGWPGQTRLYYSRVAMLFQKEVGWPEGGQAGLFYRRVPVDWTGQAQSF